MTDLMFSLPEAVSLPVNGADARYPLGRIFCVGRNYAARRRPPPAFRNPLPRAAISA